MISDLGLSISFAFGGLGLFLVAIKLLSSGFKNISGDKLKIILNKFTKTNFHALMFGFIFTALIHSSDGAIALIISLISAGFLPLRRALAFVLGANIGTATTSIIVSLASNFEFTQYFMFLAFIGGMGYLLIKDKAKSNVALIITSLGLLFVGLKILGLGMQTITKQEIFSNMISSVGTNSWLTCLLAFAMTGIMQSSTATVTIAQTLYQNSSSLTLIGGIGFVAGANIGTTVTAFLASISGGKNTRRIAAFWMITNLFTAVLIVLPIIKYYSLFIETIIPTKINARGGHDNFQLAIGHVFFNLILVLIFFPILKYMEIFIKYIVKSDKETELNYKLNLSNSLILNSPQLAVESSEKAFSTLGEINLDLIDTFKKFLINSNKKYLERIERLVFSLKENKKELYSFVTKLNSEELTTKDSDHLISIAISTKTQGNIASLMEHLQNLILESFNQKKKQIQIDKNIIEKIIKNLNILYKLQQKSTLQSKKWSISRNADMKKLNQEMYDIVEKSIENHAIEYKNKKEEIDNYSLMHIFERIAKHQYNISKFFKVKNKKNK